eukprot:scaffold37092_cov42-Cyclotella_meneghiniana.AAC.1
MVHDRSKRMNKQNKRPLLNVSLYNHLASTLSQPPLSESDSALLESHHKSSLESLSGLITKAQQEMGDGTFDGDATWLMSTPSFRCVFVTECM